MVYSIHILSYIETPTNLSQSAVLALQRQQLLGVRPCRQVCGPPADPMSAKKRLARLQMALFYAQRQG
jgi:hypothetical protein